MVQLFQHSNSKLLSTLGLGLLLPLVPACGAGDGDATPPTYHQDIAPILSENCSSCHSPSGMQPDLLFDDADSAAAMSMPIKGSVLSGAMPPFYAKETEDCPNPWGFHNDPSLSEEQKQLISDWADAGAPAGDPATAAPLPPPVTTELAAPDLTLEPPVGYTTSVIGAVEDEFVCFSLDPELEEQHWLEAFQVVPDDLRVVHHVLVGVDLDGASADLADENGIYPCFGGFGIPATFIGGWVPSASPTVLPAHSAMRVPAGARLVMQMHYHLTSEPVQDATGLAIRWADEAPVREAYVSLLGNENEPFDDGTGLLPGPSDAGGVEFRIPAGAGDHTETIVYDDTSDEGIPLEVFLVGNHMHYVGTDMRMWLERDSGAPADVEAEACLVHTPDWDFDWQQFYFYDASNGNAPVIYPGDALWLRCEYDNRLSNPGVAKALAEAGLDAPIDVYLGEGSLDEMCIGILGVTPQLTLTTQGQTHRGDTEIQVESAGLNINAPCLGFTSLALSGNSVRGLAACGLDTLGTLITLQFEIEGTTTAEGGASGTLTASTLDGLSIGTLPWSGSYQDGNVTIPIDITAPVSGSEVSFLGTLRASAD